MADKGAKADFKAVKVTIKQGNKNISTVSRSMLYSGVNIFGQLTQKYLDSKQEILESGGVMPESGGGGGAAAAPQEMMALPQEVMMIFKRVQKKDPVTKCKAFKELDDYLIKVEEYSDEHYSLTTIFLYHYCRIQVNETDKKVREAAQTSLGCFIAKGKKTLAPHMSKIFPIWFCSFYDTSPEVANIGQTSFKAAFKGNKGDQAFKVSFQYFLHFADEHLKQTEEQLSENARDMTKTMKEENYDRIVSAILQALAESFQFVKNWPEEDRLYYIKKLVSYLGLKKEKVKVETKTVKEDETDVKKKQKNQKKETEPTAALWLLLTKKSRGKVRASCMLFVSKFLQNVPREVSELHIDKLAPLVLDMVAEDNSIIQSTLWKEAYQNIGKEFPEAWSMVQLKKSFIPGLMSCLKNAAFGATIAFYPNIVRFVSAFPLFHMADIPEDKNNKFSLKDRAKFVTQFYQHIFAGLKNDEAPNYHRDLTGAYFETLTFFLVKRFQPLAEKLGFDFEDEGLSFVWSQLQMVLDLPIKDYLLKHEKCSSKALQARNLRSSIPERYGKMLKDLSERKIDARIMSKITEQIFGAYSDFGQYQGEEAEKNAARLAKTFVKLRFAQGPGQQKVSPFGASPEYESVINQQLTVRLIKKVYETELQSEIEEIGRKTLDQVVAKCQSLKKIAFCMAAHGLSDSCFEVITATSLLKLTKSLDETQSRNAARLDKNDHRRINLIKEYIVYLSLLALSQEKAEDGKDFFNYVLVEQKMISFDIQRLVILPQKIPKVSDERLGHYFKNLRQNEEIVTKYITNHLMEDIASNSANVNQILTQADSKMSLFASNEKANSIAQLLLKKMEETKDSKLDFLRAATYVLGRSDESKTVFDPETVQSLQKSLVISILEAQSSNSKTMYSDLWTIFSSISEQGYNYSLLNISVILLKDWLKTTISKINEDEKAILSYANVEKVKGLTQTIQDFVMLCEAHQRQPIVEYILLAPENFQNCDKNYLPMMVFRDMFLQGGIAFDITSLFQAKSADTTNESHSLKALDEWRTTASNYGWLASLLLNISNMPSLNNLPDLKRQLALYLDTEVLPAILIAIQNGQKGLMMELINSVNNKITNENDSCLSTLESFISKLANPEFLGSNEPILKVDEFKKIFFTLCKEKCQKFLEKKFSEISPTDVKLMSIVFKHTAYFILDEPEVSNLIKLVKKSLHIDILTKQGNMQEVAYCIQLYLSLYTHFQTDYDSEMQEFVIQWIIGNFTENFFEKTDQSPKIKSYQLNVILNFLASMIDHLGVLKFNNIITHIPEDTLMKWKLEKRAQELEAKAKAAEEKAKEEGKEFDIQYVQEVQDDDTSTTLETLILQVVKLSHDIELDPETYIFMLVLMRKVLPDNKIITQKQFMIDEIVEMAKDKVQLFDNKINNFLRSQSGGEVTAQLQIGFKEEAMLSNFAETLLTCALYINEDVNENSLYVLINSGFSSLQKAAYFMLNHLYKNFIPKVLFKKDVEEEMQQLMVLAIPQGNNQDQEEQIAPPKVEDLVEEKARDKFEFKNVPKVLVELIESTPEFTQPFSDQNLVDKDLKPLQAQIESLIFGEAKDGCLSRKSFGYLLAWGSVLKKIDNGRIKAQLAERDDYTSIIGTITEYLEQNTFIYETLLVIIVAFLPKVKKVNMKHQEILDFDPAQTDIEDPYSARLMSLYALVGFMKSFPSLARKYYQNCDKQLLEIVMPYIKSIVSPAILDNEIQKIEISQITLNESGQGEGLTFSLFKSTKEFVAEYTKGEVSMQLKLMIPSDYPMKSVVVEVGQQLKITERQKNKWILSIKNLLQLRNGDIISAVLLWKSNIDKEIEGVEDCMICYCVLHPTDKSLPRMPCKNCKNKFHVACVRKWFKTSNKSNCPLCQQYFF